MKFTLSWLKDHLETNASVETIADTLTRIGLEVENIEDKAEALAAFTIAEAQGADEAFVTSASAFLMPVVEIDGAVLGDGSPGPVALRLREIYIEESRKTAI